MPAVWVEVTNESGWFDLDVDHWAQVATDTLVGEGVRTGGVDVLFVDVDRMAALNAEHMGSDGPTDVLSFPLDDPFASSNDPSPVHIGDVVVCPSVAAEQAPGHCGDTAAELTLLIVHGVLHLLGHDHAEADEEARMIERERVHMARCGYPHPGPVAR